MGTTLVSETKWNLVEADVHEVGMQMCMKWASGYLKDRVDGKYNLEC